MPKTKNTLGILGLGNRSTLFYIDALNKTFNNTQREYNTFPFILYNTDFNQINPYLPDNFDKLLPRLSEYIKQIEKLPISHLLIPNITLHEALDKLKISLTILHPLALSLNYLKENNKKQVVVFGSKYTMTSTYISNYLAKEGIEVTSPSKKDMEFIDNLRTKIYSNSETPSEIEVFNILLKKYSQNTLVLIACTELSILKSSIDVLDMTYLQVEKALKLHKN
ncbi:aspartate/glutamate racemase family protein [Xanthomarina sp. F2636L]|uniref:aspartate/glutamate racemase family protein n=1 Tax=Xanthomarina sp. F2636L TaxID=2996018 RepID=UPI00225E1630|nr:aspartate/glutamate racemase family protein [Xanthomarina sp. F2636L]MCX7550577.1 aspartate/glutamate racemase family protein [Xanthomarina sp. F2636L]